MVLPDGEVIRTRGLDDETEEVDIWRVILQLGRVPIAG